MRECGEKQVLADTMGCQPGIGEEVVSDMGEQEVGKKRTFARVLKEQSYKALQEQDQRRKDKAAMVAQERRVQTAVSATKSKTVIENQDELENQQEEMGKRRREPEKKKTEARRLIKETGIRETQ